MGSSRNAFIGIVFLALFTISTASFYGPLKIGYYKHNKSCVQAEEIIKKAVDSLVSKDPTLAASLLRVHFHDCFVRGCEGSVLLNSTKNSTAERDAPPNLSLRGFEAIDAIKTAVEAACPNTVSCADILALAARDAVFQIHGPFWKVPTGRRDGVVSIDQETRSLPPFFSNFTVLRSMFAAKGLNVIDLVALSGAHTIGVTHCSSIDARLYNFSGNGDTDPSLDSSYAAELKQKCKQGDQVTKIPMDPTVGTFDTSYYEVVSKNKGMFQSDAALLNSTKSKFLLDKYMSAPMFLPRFSRSMTKMGVIGVLTGNQGEIRKKCSVVN